MELLKERIRSIPDWPIKGVTFRDITTLMQDPKTFKLACDQFYNRYKSQKIDKIAAIEARGFVSGAVLAYQLDVGFVPIRKKGKLPYKTISENYALEYGENTMEIHEDAIQKGDKVLLVDDLIATGGTAAAAAKLVERLGGEIIECAFIVELPDLNGRQKINGKRIYTIVQFDGD